MEPQPLESVRDVMGNIAGYLPTLLAGLIVLVLGGIVAWVAAKLAVRILIFLRLDRVIVRFGWGRALEKGDVRHSLFGLVGTILGFLVFLVFLENAIVLWKLTVLSQLLERLILLIPQLMVGRAHSADRLGGGRRGLARRPARALSRKNSAGRASSPRSSAPPSSSSTCAIALVELDIAVTIVTGAFLITFGALALSFALAFGLGSRRAVESMWEQRLRPPKDEPPDKKDKPDTQVTTGRRATPAA